MRWFLTILGVLLILAGTVWILQGTGTAFATGAMAFDKRWAYIGAGVDVVAVILIIFANRRKRLPPSS